MKITIPAILLLSVALLNSCNSQQQLRDGDIIFHASQSSQSKAIQLATGSKYSHCGIIYQREGMYYVFEAVQPVKSTPLDQWIKRGAGSRYVVKRLKNADRVLTTGAARKMKEQAAKFVGKDYDLWFEWSDERIYCSELIWKIYERGAGVKLGKLQSLSDFDLSSEIVRSKMHERYGGNLPLDEKVISPAAIFDSHLLVMVASN